MGFGVGPWWVWGGVMGFGVVLGWVYWFGGVFFQIDVVLLVSNFPTASLTKYIGNNPDFPNPWHAVARW